MALELGQEVTGHKTTVIILKQCFQLGREDFRRTMQLAMPELANGLRSPEGEMKDILDLMTAKNWKKDQTHLLG